LESHKGVIPSFQCANAPAEEIANPMLAEARFSMGAKVGSHDGLQTFDMFASTWFANYNMFAKRSTRIARLANIRYVCDHVAGKDIICSHATQNNTLFILRNRPPPLCANQHPYGLIQLILCFLFNQQQHCY
jgi:hypothetical protein